MIGDARSPLDAQRQLLSDTAHELRTPLAVILGHAELLLEGLGSDEALSSVQAIAEAAGAMEAILRRRTDELHAAQSEFSG